MDFYLGVYRPFIGVNRLNMVVHIPFVTEFKCRESLIHSNICWVMLFDIPFIADWNKLGHHIDCNALNKKIA